MIGSYAVDKFTLNQFRDSSEYGVPNTRTQVQLKGYIDFRTRVVMIEGGSMVTSMGSVKMRDMDIVRSEFSTRGSNSIADQDTLTIDGATYTILKIVRGKDFSVRFMEVYFA